MRTPPGLSIRKLAWPRKVIVTAPSGTTAASHSGPPATTPVHAAEATDAKVDRRTITQSRNNSLAIRKISSHRRRPVPITAMGPGLRRDDGSNRPLSYDDLDEERPWGGD